MSILNERLVALEVEADTAEEAIRKSGELLMNEGKVEQTYVDAMVKGYKDIGPYIVLAPGIAIPHARPEHGVNEQCLSIVRLKEPVAFDHPTNDPVRLVCAIGGTDNHGHIEMLRSLSESLGDQAKLEGMLKAKNYEEFSSYLNL
jgi:ascorbate PTS system EIIA or EIIAB component